MKKLFSLLALALVLSACGNSADKKAEEPTETTTTTQAPAEETTEEEAPAEEETEEGEGNN